jgi:hypothetical protein
MEKNGKVNPSELPFLVTHWLSNFQARHEEGDNDDAIRRIHDAASQMASAFSDLGMFGTANKVRGVLTLVLRHASKHPVLIILSSHNSLCSRLVITARKILRSLHRTKISSGSGAKFLRISWKSLLRRRPPLLRRR